MDPVCKNTNDTIRFDLNGMSDSKNIYGQNAIVVVLIHFDVMHLMDECDGDECRAKLMTFTQLKFICRWERIR